MPREAGLSLVTVALAEPDLPAFGHFEPGEDPQQGRLARSRRPEQRDELAVADRQRDVVERRIGGKALRDALDPDRHVSGAAASSIAVSPLERGFEREGDDGEEGKERGDGEGGDKVVVIVKCLHLERHGVGLAADVTGNDADRSKLSHRPRVAQQHAVEEAEADIGQGHAPEGLPAGCAERQRGFFVGAALGAHQRDELARDEREGDEHGRQHEARKREDDADVVVCKPRAEPALGAEDQDEHQAGDDRRDREGELDQRDQRGLAAEVELGDRPGGGDAEDGVQRHRDRGDDQRQPDRRAGVRFGDRGAPQLPALAQALR